MGIWGKNVFFYYLLWAGFLFLTTECVHTVIASDPVLFFTNDCCDWNVIWGAITMCVPASLYLNKKRFEKKEIMKAPPPPWALVTQSHFPTPSDAPTLSIHIVAFIDCGTVVWLGETGLLHMKTGSERTHLLLSALKR